MTRLTEEPLVANQEQESGESLYPQSPAPEAYYGLAGDIVRTIEPETESDPVAILSQLLTAFGNVIGRTAHFSLEADRHPTNIFMVLVAKSSKGRKGTAWGQARRLFRTADEAWLKGCLATGLSSGEGLIYHVRDQQWRKQPVKQKGRVVGYEDVMVDEGVTEKRLLVVEAEFASTLKVMKREGNTLSPVIRQAWDTGNLRTLTKNSPTKASAAMISIIGHITAEELRRNLDTTEMANGFANRFLWLCATRSKYLPDGGNLSETRLRPLLERLGRAVERARGVGLVTRDQHARDAWHAVYPELSAGRPGLLGSVTSRAEAQVTRLSLVYALLDLSDTIRLEHLQAALALWEYCEASARFIFGDSLGDPMADEILQALRSAPNGLTRTDLRDLFGRNKSGADIDRALAVLQEYGLARYVDETGTGGRPARRWFATRA